MPPQQRVVDVGHWHTDGGTAGGAGEAVQATRPCSCPQTLPAWCGGAASSTQLDDSVSDEPDDLVSMVGDRLTGTAAKDRCTW